MSIKNQFTSPHIYRTLFLAIAILLLAFNLQTLFNKLQDMRKVRQKIPFLFMGYKFSGLKDILADTQIMGYYTDKDLDAKGPALQFAQAQYILAPVILDLNNIDHEFILFDCSRPEIAQDKIKEFGMIPLRKNQFDIILAKNPRAQQE